MKADAATGEPQLEYEKRRDAWQQEVSRWQAHEGWLSKLRLIVFAVAFVLGWFSFGSHVLAPGWVGFAAFIFVVLVIAHDRVIQRRTRAERSHSFYERGLARIENRWAGQGEGGESYVDPEHPYAEDLDLFGRGSIFELLCMARTPAGEAALANWLAAPAAIEVVRARQQAVEELRSRLELREELALLGDDARSKLRPKALTLWGDGAGPAASAPIRAFALAISIITLASGSAWLASLLPPAAFVVSLAVQTIFALSQRSRVRAINTSLAVSTRDLRLLGELLERIEREPAESPLLQSLLTSLNAPALKPSRQVARLERLMYMLEARQNQFFAPVAALLLWTTQVSLAIEAWRASSGSELGRWIESAGDFEALCSLSAYAYEHPQDPFPELEDNEEIFDGEQLGHPLLPDETCIRNDVRLGGERRAFLLSGSNMSGKSTLLRTVGVNALLAFAGAPVRAKRLRISPLTLAASIRVRDSLQDGVSHFYAEIQQLRRIVELTDGARPVLFLLDELLHGTNSHDRRVGSEAVLRGLLARGAIGLVTTHDLALAKIADELAPKMENIHLEDHLDDGVMSFDYQLRPGVVAKSNALELMRSVGLDV